MSKRKESSTSPRTAKRVEEPTRIYTSIDLFAGAGGLSIGFRDAGIKSVYAVEYDKHAAKTFELNFPDAKVSCADVRSVDFSKYRGRVDIVCGGPPCQPFSSGGLRNAADDARDMIPTFIEAVRNISPRAFLMENVNGLTVGERRIYLDSVLEKLQGLGYNITWRVVNAADYGVPQIRKRLIVVGVREGVFEFPEPTHGPQGALPHVSAGEVLATITSKTVNSAKVTYARNPDLRPNPYHGQLYNGGGRPIDLEQPAPTILASAGGNKTHFIDVGGLVVTYHGHLARGGAPQIGELPEARRLTVEESAALQTFPADMTFSGPQSSQYRQIGNAVPPQLGYVLGVQLISHLNEHKTKTSPLAATQLGLFAEQQNEPMAKAAEGPVYETVSAILATIDRFLTPGEGITPQEIPKPSLRGAVDALINRQSASVVNGCLFLTFYKVINPSYEFEAIPVGSRGPLGDKLLGAQLKYRYLTLGQVTAWVENVGAKGNQGNFDLHSDSRFSPFIAEISQASQSEVQQTALYMASRFAASQARPALLPPLSPSTLSFVRAKVLFRSLATAESGGAIQQFLVAALLGVLRAKQDIVVKTHNINGADVSDRTAGDIEEFVEGKLLRAYEVTARPDWKNRLPDFRQKMDKAGLDKYIIIASNVNNDDELREPAQMALKIEAVGRDIAVVDIMDFLNWMAAELSAVQLQDALQETRNMLITPGLGGKHEHVDTYVNIVGAWLDSVAQAAQAAQVS